MQDVATRADVSIGTVSRVFHGDPSVSASLSSRVTKIAQELGYRRLRRERGATSSHPLRGKTIGVMLLGMGPSLAASPLVGMALDGIRRELSGEEALLQILDIPDPTKPNATLDRSKVDAWLVKGSNVGNIWKESRPSLRKRLSERPTVWFHGQPEGACGAYVGADETGVGALAARSLADHGHTHVAFLTTRRDQRLLLAREKGFHAECDRLGLTCSVMAASVDEFSFPLEKPNDEKQMLNLLRRLLKRRNRPTAVFVPADSFALLLYRAMHQCGLRPGKDLSIISANGEWPLIVGLSPTLATIDIQSEGIGRRVVQRLASCFHTMDASPTPELLKPTLHMGESLQSA